MPRADDVPESSDNNDAVCSIDKSDVAMTLLQKNVQAADGPEILTDVDVDHYESSMETLANDPATHGNGYTTGTRRNESDADENSSFAAKLDLKTKCPTFWKYYAEWKHLWEVSRHLVTKQIFGTTIVVLALIGCLLFGSGWFFGSYSGNKQPPFGLLNSNGTYPPKGGGTIPIELVCGDIIANHTWLIGRETIVANGIIKPDSNYMKKCPFSVTSSCHLQVNATEDCAGLFICESPPHSPRYCDTRDKREMQDGKMTCKTKDEG